MTIDDSIPNTSAGTGGGMPPAVPMYKQIGRYEIIRELGRGAMGVVFEAKDPKIQRSVALKVLHDVPGVAAAELDEFKSRFFREARTAGMLGHPNIVVIHDVDSDEQLGISFMAMEYLKGQTVYDLLKSGVKFTTEQAIDICIQVAEGLDHAHRQNIVHRDVKPANLMLLEDGTVKITDFGIAKISTSNLTRTGQFLGTPNYMSPEQVIGHVIDGRSDLFSLGIIVYELLTGEKPFMGSSLTTITYQIVNVDPIEPSKIRPGLSKRYDAIAQKLLRKAPDERFQTGKEVAEALRQARAGAVASQAAPAVSGDAETTQISAFNASAARPPAGPPPEAAPATAAAPARPASNKLVIALAAAALLVAVIAAVVVMTRKSETPPVVATASAPAATAPAGTSAPGTTAAPSTSVVGAPGDATSAIPASAPETATAATATAATATTAPATAPRSPTAASPTAPRRPTAAPATVAQIAASQAAMLLPAQQATPVNQTPAQAKGQSTLKVVFEHKLKSGTLRVELDGKQVLSRDISAGQRKKDTLSAEVAVPDGKTVVNACIESSEIQDGPKCAQRTFSFVMNRAATMRAQHGKPMMGPHWFTMELE